MINPYNIIHIYFNYEIIWEITQEKVDVELYMWMQAIPFICIKKHLLAETSVHEHIYQHVWGTTNLFLEYEPLKGQNNGL